MTYYDLLEIPVKSDFHDIRKAYYRKAKTCHPDLFGNDPFKTEEFRRIVEAFDVLSDPDRRKEYDEKFIRKLPIRLSREKRSILDTEADDILEELIVGNTIPEGTTLMTLLLDLERTEIFMRYREARNYLGLRRYRAAVKLFEELTDQAPFNILYHVFLARSYSGLGKFYKAKREYALAIVIGSQREPPLNLRNIKDELDDAMRRKNPLFYRIMRFFFPKEYRLPTLPDEQMLQETNRAIDNMIRQEQLEDSRREKLESDRRLLKK